MAAATRPAPITSTRRASFRASSRAASRLSPAVFHLVTRWKSTIASSAPVASSSRVRAPFTIGSPRPGLPGNTVAGFTAIPSPSIQALRVSSVSGPR